MGLLSATLVIAILVGGIILMAVEVFVVPGTSIAGISGVILLVLGVVLSYIGLGIPMGNRMLLLSVIASVILIVIGYRTVGKKGLALDYKLKERAVGMNKKVDELTKVGELQVGDKGVALGDIRPQGKAIINNRVYEVFSENGYISDNDALKVVKIEGSELVVRQV